MTFSRNFHPQKMCEITIPFILIFIIPIKFLEPKFFLFFYSMTYNSKTSIIILNTDLDLRLIFKIMETDLVHEVKKSVEL